MGDESQAADIPAEERPDAITGGGTGGKTFDKIDETLHGPDSGDVNADEERAAQGAVRPAGDDEAESAEEHRVDETTHRTETTEHGVGDATEHGVQHG